MRASVVMATMGQHDLAPILACYLQPSSRDIEVVVIVDRPSANPVNFVGSYLNDPRLRIIRNEENIGLAKSLNRGIEAAAGHIIIRNDDDDLPTSDRPALMLGYFDAHPDVDIVYSFANGEDRESGSEWMIEGPTSDADIKQALGQRNFIVHSSIAFRRDSIRAIGSYSPHFRFAQDYELYLRSMRNGLTFGCVDTVTMRRVYHADSATVARRKRQILYSFSAKLLHHAETGYDASAWRSIASYCTKLAIPNSLRALRRRIGRGV